MQTFFQSITLGIIQGLTEFLPISSTAHLRIIPALFHWKDPGTAFSAVIQLGSMFSILIYFWKDLKNVFTSKLAFWIIIATLPICFFGILFKEQIELGYVRDFKIVSFSLIFFGVVLFLSDFLAKQEKKIEKLNFLDVFIIGLAQSLALIPGVSRSAITISSGLFLGLKRYDAARFSFLLSIPSILLSGVFEMNTFISSIRDNSYNCSYVNVIIGAVSAFIAGYIAIDFLLKYLQRHKTYIFVIYRVLLGIIIMYLNYRRFIH
ncbi:MAG: undecaprenyl-diphosphatase UppP [Candidatus Melainabacteria bacterium]|nr:undecaprenyl-diphosphatase UppP [Candidatus Melainabacteria bacterium]